MVEAVMVRCGSVRLGWAGRGGVRRGKDGRGGQGEACLG